MRFLPTYEKGIGKENHNQCQQKATPNHILIPTTPFNKGTDLTTHILQKKKVERERGHCNICHSFSSHFGCGRGIKRESLLKHFFLLLTSSSCWNCRQSDWETDKTRTTARWSFCVNIIIEDIFLPSDIFLIWSLDDSPNYILYPPNHMYQRTKIFLFIEFFLKGEIGESYACTL